MSVNKSPTFTSGGARAFNLYVLIKLAETEPAWEPPGGKEFG